MSTRAETATAPARAATDARRSSPRRRRIRWGAIVTHGVLLTAWILGKLAPGLTEYRSTALRAIALYWHVVNVLGLVVTGVILSARV